MGCPELASVLPSKEPEQGLAQGAWELSPEWLRSSAQQGLGWAAVGSYTSLRGSGGWASADSAVLAPGGPRRAGHVLVWHGSHLPGGLQGQAQGAEEEPVWQRQLLLAGLQILLQR